MTKSEMIDAIAARAELTKARAEMVVNCVFDTMTEALQRGEGIEIRGFGSFTVRPYKPYDGRNPRTGQPVPVPAKRLPFFKVGKELKELVNGSRHIAMREDPDVIRGRLARRDLIGDRGTGLLRQIAQRVEGSEMTFHGRHVVAPEDETAENPGEDHTSDTGPYPHRSLLASPSSP